MSKPVMEIVSWNRTSEILTVLMSGKRYEYFDVGPTRYRYIQLYVKHKQHARLFKMLRACSKPQKVERRKPSWTPIPQKVKDIFNNL